MSYRKEELLRIVTDPQKRDFANRLSDVDVDLLTGLVWTDEHNDLLEAHPEAEMMHTLRTMYYNRLTDWATSEADSTQQEMLDFIDSPTFVQYPDFFLDEAILAAIRVGKMDNHSQSLKQFLKGRFGSSPGVEIVGARIGAQGDVEVMFTHNTSKMYEYEIFFFDIEKMDLPPVVKTGILVKNGILSVLGYGRGDEVYIATKSPYPGRWGAEHYTEIVIGNIGEDGIIVPVEDV